MNLSTIIPWMLTILSVTVSAWQYNLTSEQKNREPFLTKQLEFSLMATDALSTLAVETEPAKWEEARKTFWKLYWGPLAIVEDRGVEAAMVRAGAIVPRAPVTNPALPMASLNKPSLDLAHAARELILESWDVDLPALAGKQP